MPTRQIEAERVALKAFGQKYGKMPDTPEDWSRLHVIAYPNLNDLPAEFKNDVTESLYAGTSSAPPARPNLDELHGDVEAAKGKVTELGTGNTAIRVLQEAIGKKAGFKDTPVGTSKIFEQAGVGGMGALSASLNTRSQEIEINRTDYRNLISEMTGQYKEMADLAMFNYEAAVEQYNNEKDSLEKTDKDLRDHEQLIEIANLQHGMDIQLKSIPSYTDKINALKEGYTINKDGSVGFVSSGRGIVGGYDITDYASDPNHEANISRIMDDIGVFKTVPDIDNYIKQHSPQSPITGEMVRSASEKYGVSWEMLTSIMRQDSNFADPRINSQGQMSDEGERQWAYRTKNAGNYGNYEGSEFKFDSWGEGVDKVAEWLNKHKLEQDELRGIESDELKAKIITLPVGQQQAAYGAIQSFQNAADIVALLDSGVKTGPIRGNMLTGLDIFGFPITPSKQGLGYSSVEEDSLLTATTIFAANYIKAISGTQVSNKERENLMKALPDANKQEGTNRNNLKTLLETLQNLYETQIGIDFNNYPEMLSNVQPSDFGDGENGGNGGKKVKVNFDDGSSEIMTHDEAVSKGYL